MKIILEMEGKKNITITPEIGMRYIIEVTEDGNYMNVVETKSNNKNTNTSRVFFNEDVMFIDNGRIVQE